MLCEKPFTTDAAQAAQLVDARERAGVVGALGHEFRWNPARAAIGAAITSGAIGEPRLATVVEYSPFLLHSDDALAMPSWFEEPGIGGWLGANGSHTLDQLRVWLGPFRSVSASMLVSAAVARPRRSRTRTRPASRWATASRWCSRTSARRGPRAGFVAVTGTAGTVGIDDGEAWIADADGTRPLVGPAAASPIGGGRVDDDLDALGSYEIRHYEKLAAAFRAAIEGRESSRPWTLPTFADGLGVMLAMDAMRASAAAGGTLTSVEGA